MGGSLALTSNEGAKDFQFLSSEGQVPLFESVVKKCLNWGSSENLMFVVGATRLRILRRFDHLLQIISF